MLLYTAAVKVIQLLWAPKAVAIEDDKVRFMFNTCV